MKKIKSIFKLTIFIGIIIILGTAGASDMGRLSVLESLSQIIFGLILIVCGNMGINFIKLISLAHRKRPAIAKSKPCKRHTAKAA